MTRVDAHAHLVPAAYRALLPPPPSGAPPVATVEPSDLLEAMERHEIDAAVVSTGPPGASSEDQVRANELARAANESIAAIVRGDQRFAGLGLLPLPDPDAAISELRHALDVLGLDGVMLLTNTAGAYLGDGRWVALYEELDRRGAYVLVHPTFPPYRPPLASEHPPWYELPFDTTRVIAHMLFSGLLERHVRIRFQFAHLGGTALFLAHRLCAMADKSDGSEPGTALTSLRRQYFDTAMAANEPAMAAARAAVGIDHLVFGTDWPYGPLPPEGGDPAPGLRSLDADDRAAVDGGNVASLVPRLI